MCAQLTNGDHQPLVVTSGSLTVQPKYSGWAETRNRRGCMQRQWLLWFMDMSIPSVWIQIFIYYLIIFYTYICACRLSVVSHVRSLLATRIIVVLSMVSERQCPFSENESMIWGIVGIVWCRDLCIRKPLSVVRPSTEGNYPTLQELIDHGRVVKS